ncbi:keratin, type II cytoskeletal 2 epidermal-like [Osmerus mordax]|uniref:keratin, type II cytoskeletal 2 epidermal-like n=1 Tax=Osmerus mordax TaxID=8014 RepID=UPI00350FCC59
MYGSSLPPRGKLSPQGRKTLQRSQGKSCGYYLRIAFFFSSLIQSLIIVGLVLFLVYGKPQDSASETRIRDLEGSFNRMSMSNQALREQRTNLSRQLNTTLLENRGVLAQLKHLAEQSTQWIKFLNGSLMTCELEKKSSRSRVLTCPPPISPFAGSGEKTQSQSLLNCEAKNLLVHSNFSQTNQHLRITLDRASQERDTLHLDTISLRRDVASLTNQLEQYTRKCKEDFAQSLSGISDVSKAFLEKIDTLVPQFVPFQLSCEKQRNHLEQIQTNCSSLSRQVETKFQRYLDNVGTRVSEIQAQSSRLEGSNTRLEEDLHWCRRNHSSLMVEHASTLRRSQERHDQEKESILEDLKIKRGEVALKDALLSVKTTDINILKESMKRLNASCPKHGGFPPSSRTGSAAGFGAGSLGTGFGGAGISSVGFGSSGPGVLAPNSRGSGGAGPAGTGSVGAGPAGTGSVGVGPARTWSVGAGPAGAGSVGAGPAGAGSVGAGPARTGSGGSFSFGRMGGAPSTGHSFSQASMTQLLKDLQSYTKPSV